MCIYSSQDKFLFLLAWKKSICHHLAGWFPLRDDAIEGTQLWSLLLAGWALGGISSPISLGEPEPMPSGPGTVSISAIVATLQMYANFCNSPRGGRCFFLFFFFNLESWLGWLGGVSFRSFHLTFPTITTHPTGQGTKVGLLPTTKYIYPNYTFGEEQRTCYYMYLLEIQPSLVVRFYV